MNPKRILCLILASLMLAAPALAVAGDRSFLRGDEPFQSLGGFPDGGCAAGGALYLYTPTHIYVWRPGDDAPAAMAYELNGEDGSRVEIARLFADGGRPCALCAVYDGESGELTGLEIAELRVDGGSVSFGAPVAVDGADGLSAWYGEFASLAQICGAVVAGGRLFLDFYGDAGERSLCVIDLASGEADFPDVEHLAAIADYDGTQLLVETWDRDSGEINLLLYDPEADEFAPARAPLRTDSPFHGLAYSRESGRLFYLADGYVMAAEGFDIEGAQPVAELAARYPEEAACALLPGDQYVYISAFESICVRETGAGALPQERIVVAGGGLFSSMMDGYYRFNASHDGAAAVLREDFAGDDALLEKLLSRDDSVDVYEAMVSGELYDALRRRGYLAPLDDATLAEAVGGMYPPIRDALTLDGRVVAVPVYVSCWTLGLDYEGFERLGILRNDVPDNWPDFLDLLSTLPERLPDDGSVRAFPEYATQAQVRAELIGEILDSWHLRARAAGEEPRYDAPELCAALEKAMALDLDALGVKSGGDEEYAMVSVSGSYAIAGERDYTLINTGADCSISGTGFEEPALLSVIPGEEAPLPLDLTVLFVNPASKHIGLAQEYLACVYESLGESELYALSDRLNEPVEAKWYAESAAEVERQIAAIEEKLADPALEDRALWEEQLAALERERETVEANRWSISPERIARYRSLGGRLAVKGYNYVNVTDPDGDLAELIQQLLSGRLDAQSFLREVDRRVSMKNREGA